tara:strand:- start:1552 stop:2529 length:978 start_codon:yes stop_codon:yes gene_type:complete
MLSTLLSMMSDGRFHSGETLGEALGVSRAAVWKSLGRLESEGFPIQRVRGKGYRIPKGAVLLDLDAIRQMLPADIAARWQWHLYQDIDSTNAQAQRLLAEHGRQPLVCISERQTSGRGRRGRAWVSPYGQNIYMSLVEPFADGAQELEGLSLVVGIVLADTLEACGYPEVRLKWPNDLLLDNRKLAGILIEIAGDLTSECVAVIGVGINVLMQPESGGGIDQAWTSLLQAPGSGELNRNKLIATFAYKLQGAMERFRRAGFEDFIAEWDRRDAWLGRSVSIVAGTNSLQGVHQGVNERGALKLLTSEGVSLVSGGEVSLRVNNAS